METRTQGDPKIYMLPNGIEIRYQGGQPIMDGGLENMVLILLFTEKGWPMNKVLHLSEQIVSDYLSECRKPITITQIRNIEVSAEDALKPIENNGIGTITGLSVRMSSGNIVNLTFIVNPPSGNTQVFNISGFGRNWELQKEAA